MNVETPATACAALAVLIAGADEIGTVEEGRFMYEKLPALSAFADLDRAGFSKLMEGTTDWVWSTFPTQGGRVTDEGAADLVAMICKALPVDSRVDVFKAAVGLARADGMTMKEAQLLQRVCDGLEIPRGLVHELLAPRA